MKLDIGETLKIYKMQLGTLFDLSAYMYQVGKSANRKFKKWLVWTGRLECFKS
jgi:hypothetical protein